MSSNGLSQEQLGKLAMFETCTVANAIERLDIRPRNEGFINGTATCRFPNLRPVVGYAATGRIRASMPPMKGRCYYENLDWWKYLVSVPGPQIVVLEDSDHQPGMGALFGEIHARISKAFGCVAYVTNGAVRDLPGIEALGFQLFSGSLSVSHAYAHVVEFGQPVEIGGLKISPGDLLHGDLHGVHSVPVSAVHKVIPICEQVLAEDQELFELTARQEFSVEMLAAKLKDKIKERPCD